MGRDAVFSEEDFLLDFLRARDVQAFNWGVSHSQPSHSDTTALLLPLFYHPSVCKAAALTLLSDLQEVQCK